MNSTNYVLPKSILLSKTFWVQVITVVAVAFPPVQEWLKANPIEFAGALAAINVLVRFATKGKVEVLSGAAPVIAAALVPAVMILTGCTLVFLTAGCTTTTTAKDGTVTTNQFNPPPEAWTVVGGLFAKKEKPIPVVKVRAEK